MVVCDTRDKKKTDECYMYEKRAVSSSAGVTARWFRDISLFAQGTKQQGSNLEMGHLY